MSPAQRVAIRRDLANDVAKSAIVRKYHGVTLADIEELTGTSAEPEPVKARKVKRPRGRPHKGELLSKLETGRQEEIAWAKRHHRLGLIDDAELYRRLQVIADCFGTPRKSTN